MFFYNDSLPPLAPPWRSALVVARSVLDGVLLGLADSLNAPSLISDINCALLNQVLLVYDVKRFQVFLSYPGQYIYPSTIKNKMLSTIRSRP